MKTLQCILAVNPAVAGRSISSLIQMQGIGDLDRIYMMAHRDGIDYNLAFIPKSFNVPHTEDFDKHYMKQLFTLAYDLAVNGYPWQKFPPNFPGSFTQAPLKE